MYICTYIYVHIYICIFVWIFVCMYVCVEGGRHRFSAGAFVVLMARAAGVSAFDTSRIPLPTGEDPAGGPYAGGPQRFGDRQHPIFIALGALMVFLPQVVLHAMSLALPNATDVDRST